MRLRRILVHLLAVQLSTVALGAAERLPLSVVPEHYDLAFSPDVDRATFTGREAVRIRVLQPTRTIVMNAVGLEVRDATVEAGGRVLPASVTLDPARELITFGFEGVLPPGLATLHMTFSGTLGRDLRGFYSSRSGQHRYAVTQLEATDARRMFPSFDEPDRKATFALSATVTEGQMAISNGAILSTTDGPRPGLRTVQFATTKPIPSYLVALAVGPFECRGRDLSGVPVRVCAPRGKAHLTAFALDATAAALEELQAYMAIDYPFGKLDLVAIPDFAAGAMENAGAMFFRESLLLVDAERASVTTRSRIALVIAHELAHQWFGNLVTMRWWNDLWLNEGFATWMEAKVVSAWKPEWQVDLDEQLSVQRAAAIDLLAATRPIRSPAETPAQIEELFDPIAYQKGGAVLAMVERFVGHEAFRGAVNAYLDRYAYGNASSEDFWTTVAQATGQPEIAGIVRSFVERPGIAAVALSLDCIDDRGIVTLSQSRATDVRPRTAVPPEHPAHPPVPRGAASQTAAPAPEDDLWSIPVCLRIPSGGAAGTTRQCTLLDERTERVAIDRCVPWAIANADGSGYFRSVYEPATLTALSRDFDILSPAERLSVLNDAWSEVRAGRTDVPVFLSLLAGLGELDVAAVAELVGARLEFVHEYFTTDASRAAFEEWVRSQLRSSLAHAGPADSRLRASLIRTLAGQGRDPLILARARAVVTAHVGAPERDRTDGALLDAYVGAAAITGDEALYRDYQRLSQSADTPQGRNRFLFGLAAFREPALIARTVEHALTPAVRAQDAALLIARLFDSPEGRAVAWPILQERWAALQEKTGGFTGAGRVVAALAAFCTEDALADIQRFFEAHPVPAAERTLRQTLDRIASCAAAAPSQRRALDAWLASAPARR